MPSQARPSASSRAQTSSALRASPSHRSGCHRPASRPFRAAAATGSALRHLRPALPSPARCAVLWAQPYGAVPAPYRPCGLHTERPADTAHRAVRRSAHRPVRPAPSEPGCSRPPSRGLMLHDPGRKSSFYRRFCNNARVIIQSGKHPQHISVYRRDIQPEADGCDGSRCSPRYRAERGGRRSRLAAARRTAHRRCGPPFAGCAPGCSSPAPPRACGAFSSSHAASAGMSGRAARKRS